VAQWLPSSVAAAILEETLMASVEPKLGVALSGGGHRAAFFHVGVLAKLAELGLLRRVEVISTVSGGSIVGALYYLHVKNLLEDKPDKEITDADYVDVVRTVEREYREAAATNVRGSALANLVANLKMVKPTYSRTDRAGEIYEARFYARAWRGRPKRDGRIAMRDLLIQPHGHTKPFNPDTDNQTRQARVPILLLEATTLNTGHNWRFEAMYMGEPPRQQSNDAAIRADVDKNVILERTRWTDLSPACQNFPLGAAVVASACFPGGFPPMQIPGLFGGDMLVKLVDGGVHDNQGIEGLRDRDCTHLIISDGSGQMPDKVQPSVRLPAVLGRIVSIYGDAEREQRLLDAHERPDNTAFMHLQTGLPAVRRTPTPGEEEDTVAQTAAPETSEFGVHFKVQRALANIRTDLDAFCDTEAFALMADAYQLTGRVVPGRAGIARLGKPGSEVGWPFDAVSDFLGAAKPDPRFLKVLQVGKERFLKPARMTPYLFAIANVLTGLLLAAVAVGGWLLLTPHGTSLYVAGLAVVAAGAIYVGSDMPYVKRVAVIVFDIVIPALLAIPLALVAALQLAAGKRWCSLGRTNRLGSAAAGVPVHQPNQEPP
jgi:predicted acylesterase/phospholipase RssA